MERGVVVGELVAVEDHLARQHHVVDAAHAGVEQLLGESVDRHVLVVVEPRRPGEVVLHEHRDVADVTRRIGLAGPVDRRAEAVLLAQQIEGHRRGEHLGVRRGLERHVFVVAVHHLAAVGVDHVDARGVAGAVHDGVDLGADGGQRAGVERGGIPQGDERVGHHRGAGVGARRGARVGRTGDGARARARARGLGALLPRDEARGPRTTQNVCAGLAGVAHLHRILLPWLHQPVQGQRHRARALGGVEHHAVGAPQAELHDRLFRQARDDLAAGIDVGGAVAGLHRELGLAVGRAGRRRQVGGLGLAPRHRTEGERSEEDQGGGTHDAPSNPLQPCRAGDVQPRPSARRCSPMYRRIGS
jgi:hypothetical protein